ncbi:MAG: serine/threonine protein kinase [Planctomycetales bacterium]|nr:serine/threonine protein kinase [Planctomycetales bacterium]
MPLVFEELKLGPLLGSGTVSHVFSAQMEDRAEPVAIKMLKPEAAANPLIRARFRREIDVLQRLNHPNIIRYIDRGEHHGKLFIVTELVQGHNLRELLNRFERLAPVEIRYIGMQICSALQHAHNNGIIHRDLKPSNLFFTDLGQLKLGDFGIARDIRREDLADQGITVGTAAYMSPEQICGDNTVGAKADLYSLGCVLYESITGRPVFEGTDSQRILDQQLTSIPPHIRDFVDCPPDLDKVVFDLLNKLPEKRPHSARTVQGVLSELTFPVNPMDPKTDPGQLLLRSRLQWTPRQEASWWKIAILSAIGIGIVITSIVLSQVLNHA